MARTSSRLWPTVTVLVGVFLFVVALPQQYKQWAPGYLRDASLHYGLDLAGGTQLDFRISEEEMEQQIDDLQQEIIALEARNASQEEIIIAQNQLASLQQQRQNIVEAIRTVLERRINALGVSEAVITPSYVGSEKHLLVDCPGVVDTQECIDTIGKTIQLEFKEEFTEPTEEYETQIRERVTQVKERLANEGFDVVGQDLSTELGVSYQPEVRYFEDELPEGMEGVWNRTPNSGLLEYDATIQVQGQDSASQPTLVDVPGVFLVEILQGRTATGRLVNEAEVAFEILANDDSSLTFNSYRDEELDDSINEEVRNILNASTPGDLKTVSFPDGRAGVLFLRKFVPGQTQMAASHILIAYEGASASDDTVTRTQEEAAALAAELKTQLNNGANFEALAREYSDGPSGAEGGSLGTYGLGTMVPTFEEVAISLGEGEISEPVETQFGYHIIRTDDAPFQTAAVASYDQLTITGEEAPARAAAIIGQLQRGEVTTTEDAITVRTIFFSLLPTGWKDTLLDGKHFRTATVTVDPTTNIPVVQIAFDEEGGRLFQELTKENIGKRIAIFVGGQLVSAPTVQQEIIGGTAVITGSQSFEEASRLAQDLNTGAIPAPIYLTGQRTVEATLGAQALQTSLQAALIGIIILMVYMVVTYRVLGLLANVALACYALIFFAMLKLPLFLFSSNYIVLTLAGMAGIILSIGMAVDANVLIFERMKEELRKGKMLKTAAETGFTCAWPSIRDGNMSTFITCAILFIIGTSIVRGFAVTLGLGVMISMFSAIVITRWLIRHVAELPIADKTILFGVSRR